uniref:G-protein coupled receptors family 2 profile 1 domain-containing protein n=1 Tax=Sphaeramia orbicularis TaxID=375764 RepID=A0A673A5M5_9TELE
MMWSLKIMEENKNKCLKKMKQDPPYNKAGGDHFVTLVYQKMCHYMVYQCYLFMNVFCDFIGVAGLYCSREWDGWLCWDDTPAGTHASQTCPDYYFDLEPTEKATKYCSEEGEWFRHPKSNGTWTNYTHCASSQETKTEVMHFFTCIFLSLFFSLCCFCFVCL